MKLLNHALKRFRLNGQTRLAAHLPRTWHGQWELAFKEGVREPSPRPDWADFRPDGPSVALANLENGHWIAVSWYGRRERCIGGIVLTGALASSRMSCVLHRFDPRVEDMVPVDHFLRDDATLLTPYP